MIDTVHRTDSGSEIFEKTELCTHDLYETSSNYAVPLQCLSTKSYYLSE